MSRSASFILNEHLVHCSEPEGITLVDVIRKHFRLKGAKVACREGDCGACAVIVGELRPTGKVQYRPITSCISPWVNAVGKHVVTIDGLSGASLSPIQEAIAASGATQCGFCTPGFVVSLATFFLTEPQLSYDSGVSSVDGNICRCTGYKSIERAIKSLVDQFAPRLKKTDDRVAALTSLDLLPPYFRDIPQRLQALLPPPSANTPCPGGYRAVGGGTDLFVQQPHALRNQRLACRQLPTEPALEIRAGLVVIGRNCRVEDLRRSPELNAILPTLSGHLRFFASTPIRNQASVIGNIVNASPIADITSMLLVLNATLEISSLRENRSVSLRNFYLGYKSYDLKPDEEVTAVTFPIPEQGSVFNFEKVSRRTYLDIASVNTSMLLGLRGETITAAHLSVGGVAPIPFFLTRTGDYLSGKILAPAVVKAALAIAQGEVAPISDVRGSAEYKRILLRQLLIAHFVTAFPQRFQLEDLL